MKKIILLLAILFSYQLFPGVSEASSIKNFPDVPTTHSSYEAIMWAAEQGIVSGSNGKFTPGGTVTEKQFIKMYAEFLKFPAVPNENTTSNDWSDPYYDRMVYYKAPVKGATNKQIRGEAMTRGTLAQLIAFAHGKPNDITSAVMYLMNEGISGGQNLNESEPTKRFGASNTLTRAQAATFLYRMSKNGQDKIAASVLSGGAALGANNTPSALDPTKMYPVGGNVNYYIENKDYAAYEIGVYSGSKKIGGYVTKKGASFEGYTIGQVATAGVVEKNGKKIHLFTDDFNGNKLYAIYWESIADKSLFTAIENDTSTRKYTSLEYLMVEITSAFRAQQNIAALTYDAPAARVAKNHSLDMQTNNYFDHFDKKGNGPQQRIDAAKLDWLSFGENLALNHATIFEANNGLINSKLHRDNILEAKLKKAGVGIAGGYYTMVFITY